MKNWKGDSSKQKKTKRTKKTLIYVPIFLRTDFASVESKVEFWETLISPDCNTVSTFLQRWTRKGGRKSENLMEIYK